jgi:pimeloyl-ACP methyl ester carboxylesterase
MKCIVAMVCGAMLLAGSWAVVPAGAATFTFDGGASLRRPSPVPMHSAAAERRAAAVWTPPAGARVTPTPCHDDPTFLCGSVRVPIDRAHPSHGTLDIPFTIVPHRDPSSTVTDAVFSVEGGPGSSTISGRDNWSSDPLAEERDIVLIDVRGTGPTAIRCPRFQHGGFRPSQLLEVVGRCGDRLGPDADRYGTGDVAMDTEAVREALGYPAIDMVMGSAAGVLEQAYAVRYPDRVRSIVADATYPVTDPMHVWDVGFGMPDNDVRVATLDCRRAPSCAAANPDPGALFSWLAHRVARHPVVGDVLGPSNHQRHVVVDDTELAVIVGASELYPGELIGAAQALRDGDPAPLLRLGADAGPFVVNGSFDGTASSDSAGDYVAAICNDVNMPWQRSWSVDRRERAYHRYFAALPKDAFAPLSVRGWEVFAIADLCIRWPAPDRFTPAVPHDAVFPNTPTLVLSGDFDVYVPTSSSQIVADEFPNSTLVTVAGTGHTPLNWTYGCASRIADTFVETLSVGDTTCASEPDFVWPVTASFPVHARDAEEARKIPGATDHSTAGDRRVATAAMRGVLDALIHGKSGRGPGLRGGTFVSDDHHPWRAKITFRGARFVDDVAIGGSISWAYATGVLKGDLKIRGAARGGAHLTGDWSATAGIGNHYGVVKITGTIGRHQVALQIPAN